MRVLWGMRRKRWSCVPGPKGRWYAWSQHLPTASRLAQTGPNHHSSAGCAGTPRRILPTASILGAALVSALHWCRILPTASIWGAALVSAPLMPLPTPGPCSQIGLNSKMPSRFPPVVFYSPKEIGGLVSDAAPEGARGAPCQLLLLPHL